MFKRLSRWKVRSIRSNLPIRFSCQLIAKLMHRMHHHIIDTTSVMRALWINYKMFKWTHPYQHLDTVETKCRTLSRITLWTIQCRLTPSTLLPCKDQWVIQHPQLLMLELPHSIHTLIATARVWIIARHIIMVQVRILDMLLNIKALHTMVFRQLKHLNIPTVIRLLYSPMFSHKANLWTTINILRWVHLTCMLMLLILVQ